MLGQAASGDAFGRARPPATALDWVEIASGVVVDWRPRTVRRSPLEERPKPVLQAFADALRGPLATPPCLVTFSGGRDSSSILAVAVEVARREALPPPIPITLRFPGALKADEREWQELVIGHLGLSDWVRIPIADELELLGPYAQRLLRLVGVCHPTNAYFFLPMLERAQGGALLTGVYGDQLLGGWHWRPAADARAGRAGRSWRGARERALAGSPAAVRRAAERVRFRRRGGVAPPWLAPEVARIVERRWAAAAAREPRRWDQWLADFPGRHQVRLYLDVCDQLERVYGMRIVHPLIDEGVLAAFAAAGGRDGFGNRTATTRALFGNLLPDALVRRSTKATFPLIGERTMAFARAWDGQGLPDGLVDAGRLRACTDQDFRLGCLWQLLWLLREGGC